MKYRILALVSVVSIGSALLAGCGSSTTSPSASSTVKPATGGTAVVALAPSTYPNWFFPMLPTSADLDVNMQVNALMYKPLLHITRTNTIDYKRSLASNISVNSTGTVYKITLHKKYNWSNGHPVTAQDAVFTWQLMKAASASSAPWIYGNAGFGGIPSRVQSVVANGQHEFTITLNKSSNPQWFIHNALGSFTPVPMSVWNKYPGHLNKDLSFIKKVSNTPGNSAYNVVDGPYKFKSMAPNQDWVFVPNSKYNGHKSWIKKLELAYETKSASEFTALRTNQINVGYLPFSMYNSRAQLTNDVIKSTYISGFDYLLPNMSSKAPGGIGKVFSKLYVRQALAMGINQKGIIQAFYHGKAVTGYGPISSKPNSVFYNKNLNANTYAYNIKKATALLTSHGWHKVNGVMTRHGQKLAFTLQYASGLKSLKDSVQLMKNDWAQEGIAVHLLPQQFNTLLGNATAQTPSKWQMVVWGGWTYQPDFYPTGGGLFKTGAPMNSGSYSNTNLDHLINQTYQPASSSTAVARMDQYQAYAAKHLPVIWMPYPAGTYAATGQLYVHSTSIHNTTKTYNPVTDLIAPNWWYIK